MGWGSFFGGCLRLDFTARVVLWNVWAFHLLISATSFSLFNFFSSLLEHLGAPAFACTVHTHARCIVHACARTQQVRKDDTPESMQNRLKMYHGQVKDVVAFFRNVQRVDGNRAPNTIAAVTYLACARVSVRACVGACVGASVRPCVRACVRVCVCMY